MRPLKLLAAAVLAAAAVIAHAQQDRMSNDDVVSKDKMVWLEDSGASNRIAWNTLKHGLGDGLEVLGGANGYPQGTLVVSNLVHGVPDAGIRVSEYCQYVQIYGNVVEDCEANFRWHHFDYGSPKTSIWAYRNTSYEPDDVGDHQFWHHLQNAANFAALWFYHNSLSGGHFCMDVDRMLLAPWA